MTAIVSTYVAEQGFVIGSDSLRRDAKAGEVVSDNARKIFSIEGDRIRLAYAWAGASSLFYGRGQELNFLAESANIANALATNKPESMDNFVQQFAIEMYRKLKSICLPDGRLSENRAVLPVDEFAHVLFVGYYNGKPYRTGLRFLHKDLLLQAPYMDELIQAPDGLNIFSGSAVVLEQFQPMEAPETLEEAVELIRAYIQACIDNRNTYADCANFGGRVHIATITAKEFQWIIPP